jgi:hypothetical protein
MSHITSLYRYRSPGDIQRLNLSILLLDQQIPDDENKKEFDSFRTFVQIFHD